MGSYEIYNPMVKTIGLFLGLEGKDEKYVNGYLCRTEY